MAFAAMPALAVDLLVANFTDSPDPAVRGGNLVYSLSVTNNVPDVAHNVTLNVALDAQTSFVSVSDSAHCAYQAGPHRVQCSYPSVSGDTGGPGTADVFSVDITVASLVSAGSTVSASATVSSTDTDTNPVNDSLSQTTTIDNGADLAVTLTPNQNTFPASSSVIYTLASNNIGPNTAQHVSIATTLSPNLTYLSASGSGWSCGVAAQVVTCTRSNAAIGALPDILITARITGAQLGVITSAASVSVTGAATDYNSSNDTASADISVTSGADLAITKLVSSVLVASGDNVSFTLQPRNNGPFASSNLTVIDTLPAAFTGINASGPGWSCGVSGLTITCTRASYAVGAADDITISASAPAVALATPLINSASIGAQTPDGVNSNDSSSVNFSLMPDGVDLSISKSKTPDPVAQGSNMSSTMVVQNNGPRNARAGEVKIIDTLPAGESFVSMASGSNWSCGAQIGQNVTCTYNAALNAGASASPLVLTTTATGSGVLSNTACAAYTDSVGSWQDQVTGNNCVSASVTATVAASAADLQIVKTRDLAVLAWNAPTLTYTLTVTNAGPGAVDGVIVNDPIPAYVTGSTTVSASKTGGTTAAGFNCSTGATVVCTQNSGSMAVGETAIFTIAVNRPLYDSLSQPGGVYTNTASVISSNIGDPDRSNNSSAVTVQIDPVADITVQSAATPNPTLAGTNVTWILTVNNNGPSSAANVNLSQVFTSNGGTMTFISATPSSGSCSPFNSGSQTLNCALGSLANGATATVTVVTRPDYMASPPNPRTITSDTSVSTSTQESNNANNTAQTVLTVNPAALDILVNNTDNPDPLGFVPASANPQFPDNVVTYRNIITNRGPSVASGLQLNYSMTPPAGKSMTFLGDKLSASGQTYSNYCNNLGASVTGPATLTVQCAFPPGQILLANNATTDLYLDYRVETLPASTGDSYVSSVTVSANEPETVLANNTMAQTTSVRQRVDLQLSKSARAWNGSANVTTSSVQLRQPFYYVLTVTNAGPGDSIVTTSTDALPAGLSLYSGGAIAPYNAAPYNGGIVWSNNNASPGNGVCGVSGSTVTCNLGMLEAGKVATVLIPVRATSTGNLNNCASASTNQVDLVSANNQNICYPMTVQSASLAGTVYYDQNNNGVKDGAENGIASVALQLNGTDIYGNAVSNLSVSTNGSGAFLFANLSPGAYTLSESQPNGYQDGLDVAGSAGGAPGALLTDQISAINLAANTNATGYLFGEVANASLSGFVFGDLNANALRDLTSLPGTDESAGLTGVQISLSGTSDHGPVSLNATSGANGAYSFTGLRPGVYQVSQQVLSGVTHTGLTVGSKGGNDGATPVSANTAVVGLNKRTVSNIVLVPGDAAVNYNFGEGGQSLSGHVYVDLNNNGVMDGGEFGIPGIAVTLSGQTAANVDVCAALSPNPCTVSTDANGVWQFIGIPASNGSGYTVTEQSQASAPLSHYGDGIDSRGTVGGAPVGLAGNDQISGIVIGVGQIGVNYDFGERSASISGVSYLDVDVNGALGAGDVRLPNVSVTLSGLSAGGVDVCTLIPSCVRSTDSNGNFSFLGLPASNGAGYTVTETQPQDFAEAVNSVGTQGGSAGLAGLNSRFSGIVLAAGVAGEQYLFGEKTGTISGFVYHDQNNNGVKDGGESGIGGVVLSLSGVAAGGGAPCMNAPCSALSAADGSYTLLGVKNANGAGYVITQSQPANWYDGKVSKGLINAGPCGACNDSVYNVISALPFNAAQTFTQYNFGEVLPASLAGLVYHDINNSGVYGGLGHMPGVTINLSGLDDRGASVNLSTLTGSDGRYSFNNLRPSNPGGYTISETQPAGVNDYAAASGSQVGAQNSVSVGLAALNQISAIVLPSAINGVEYNFRENASSISGRVYFDQNRNGVLDAGESGIGGVSIELSGAAARNGVTRSDGVFAFYGLAAGSYTLSESQPAGYIDSRDAAGAAGGVANNPLNRISGITLPVATEGHSYLFGEQVAVLSSLQGVVYGDLNRNGVRDPDEPLLAGVGFTLSGTDYQGNPQRFTAQTDASGQYRIINIPAGTYTLSQSQPAKWDDFPGASGVQAGTGAGGVAAKNQLSNLQFPLSGVAASGYDFREMTGLSSIAGVAYVDMNGNGVRDAGATPEPLLAQVTLSLSGQDSSGQSVTRSVQTDTNGAYLFNALLQGVYSISQSQPAAWGDFEGNSGSRVGSAGGALDAAANKIKDIKLPANTAASGYDFREKPGQLSGFVYFDANHNGLKESGESGIANVGITLSGKDVDGKQVSLSGKSAADGSFSFSGLAAGLYSLLETQPAGYVDGKESPGQIGAQSVGAVDNSAFDSNPARNQISQIALPAGQSGVNYLFGERGATLQGFVYVDANNNGQKESGENGLAGVRITLSGKTDSGDDICALRACTVQSDSDGRFVFDGLAPGRYKLVENQLDVDGVKYSDGKETAGLAGGVVNNANTGSAAYQNTIDAIDFNAGVISANQGVLGGYLFGETPRSQPSLKPPIVNGYVWRDRNHSRQRPSDTSNDGVAGWTVSLSQNGKQICLASTNAKGFYQFDNLHCPGYEESGLPTGSGFAIVFTHEGNRMPAVAISGGGSGDVEGGVISNITLRPGDEVSEQNLPLDPAGVVYDAVTRQTVAGAVVTFSGPPGYDVKRHLLGGVQAETQITGSDGLYQFFLQNDFPSGVYTLQVKDVPAGYLNQVSGLIPPCISNGLPVGAQPDPALVQKSDSAPGLGVPLAKPNACVGMVPGGADSTQYYFQFLITNGVSAPILNNHIPLDPLQPAGLSLSKSADKTQAEIGDSVRYTIVVKQNSGSAVKQTTVRDVLPAGFKLIPGTVKLNGAPAPDPQGVPGPVLGFQLGPLAAGRSAAISYRVRVGVGALQGDGVNRAQAWACQNPASCLQGPALQARPDANGSNPGQHQVRVSKGVFGDEACLAGKIFVDCNHNHVQDSEELGIPGVRLYLQDGTWLVSDVEGKYSYCGLTPKSHVLKVDALTLPKGSRLTTTSNRNLGDANSLFLDVKNGELLRADFAEGSCSNQVLEQVKARRNGGEVREHENESGKQRYQFRSKAPQAPRQASDSANQELVRPRQEEAGHAQ
ncbi:SdrD B-like domain-containing protein [Massilia sp. W12]|uniref:SdrD B-like domain-containing protein n=1 Tax=Massilia sp. W12 TaxID=3126507 RepID=UPI0030CE1272